MTDAPAPVGRLLGILGNAAASRRIARPIVQLLFLGMLAGCAGAPRLPPPLLDSVGPQYAMAVIPVRDIPDSNFSHRPYGETLAKGALAGAGAGAVGAAVAVGVLAIAVPPLGLALGLAMAPVLVGTGVVAGVVGAAAQGPGWAGSTDVPEPQRTTLVQTLGGIVASVPLPDVTADAVVRNVARFTPLRAEVVADAAPAPGTVLSDYSALRSRGFGGALEIRYTAAGFTGAKEDALSLFVTAEAYLFDTGTGNATWLRGLVYESPNYGASRWLREDGALMRVVLERAYATLAERIVDLLVLSTQPSTLEANWQANTCGVELLEPGPVLESVPQFGPTARTATPIPVLARADSLMPVLAWTALPAQRSSFGGSPWAAAKDLRYDLRVWKAVDDAPEDIVYERVGLSGTRHQVSVALEPATTYFWSVRVRGAVDGHPRAAPWSFSVSPQFRSTRSLDEVRFYALEEGGRLTRRPCASSWIECGCMDFIPTANFYRFRTP